MAEEVKPDSPELNALVDALWRHHQRIERREPTQSENGLILSLKVPAMAIPGPRPFPWRDVMKATAAAKSRDDLHSAILAIYHRKP